MPNWCENIMVVEGDTATLKEFHAGTRGTDDVIEIINGHFPCPQELMDVKSYVSTPDNPARNQDEQDAMTEKYGVATWYEWQKKHWGVKWGDCDTRTEWGFESTGKKWDEIWYEDDDDTFIRYAFQTPWVPPLKAFERISKMFPALTFTIRYVEMGFEFKGEAVIKNGHVNDTPLKFDPRWDYGHGG